MIGRPTAAVVTLALAAAVASLAAGSFDAGDVVLPPVAQWDGATRRLALPPDHPWATPFERSGLLDSPDYETTLAWIQRLVEASPRLALLSIGTSHEGRSIPMVVASATGASTPDELHASGRPVVLVQAGIHSGEIDGKDAGMMLLREMTVGGTRKEILQRVSLLFVPILNVDGHERSSAYGRINQRGPRRMGWRTNARNQNLNRDYAKLDTPEIRAIVRAIRTWRPDLYVDVHVTDGVDWQYDVTWGASGVEAHSPDGNRWLAERLDPAAFEALRDAGHTPGPMVFPRDADDVAGGVVRWQADPRFSNGYGDARHLPTVLVENHSLKPFDRRVLGTYLLLDSILRTTGLHGEELRRAVARDRARRPARIPLDWRVPPDAEPELRPLAAIEQVRELSPVSGTVSVGFTGKPLTLDVAWWAMTEPVTSVTAPRAYWIPPSRPEIVERLEWHGVRLERSETARDVEVEMYRLADVELDAQPFEGHVRVKARPVAERRRETWPAGSVRVPLDQPLGELAALLLEPASPDSFLRWGFFHDVLQRTEYVEQYVMEPTARRWLERDPELAEAFRRELAADPGFAADPQARLDWFYRQTPYYDDRWRLYPVGRELGTDPSAPQSP